MIVMVFGEAALMDGDNLLPIADTLYHIHQAGTPILAVVGPLPGVIELLRESIAHDSYNRVYSKLRSIHTNMARKLVRDERDRSLLIQDVEDILGTYNWLGKSLVNRKPTPAETALILALGGRLSVRLLSGHLQNRGLQVSALNGHELVLTETEEFLDAVPDVDLTRQRCEARLKPLIQAGYMVLVGGGSGGTADGQATWLGEDGLYRSAGSLAAINDASGLWVMHEPDGVLSADPHYVPDAHSLPVLPATTLSALVDYGDDLPTQAVLEPVLEVRIPVYVRSIFHPDNPGTFIQAQAGFNDEMGCPIAVQINQSRLHVKGVDLWQGLRTLREEGIHAVVSVDGMTYLLDDNNLNLAHLALSRAFTGLELETTRDKASLITIVGLDADYLDLLNEQMPAIVGEPQAEILVTTGASDQANLTVLLPVETLDSSIEKIHNLLREQSK